MRKNASPHKTYTPIQTMLWLAAVACVLAAGAVFATEAVSAEPLSAQAPPAQATSLSPDATAKPVHRRKRPSPQRTVVVADPAVPVLPAAPQAPPRPSWPAFDRAAEASVVWDSHGLTIDAANSSLEQILKDVSTATGAEVEGLSSDQRVFGAFGPGPAREVLSQVLQGSGYNVVMVGDMGQGTPRQIMLSVRQAGPAQPAVRNNAAGNDEDDVEEPPPLPQEPINSRPGFPVGVPRSPQQIMQEMQQRQQQIQQQQNQQQQAPTPQPNYLPN